MPWIVLGIIAFFVVLRHTKGNGDDVTRVFTAIIKVALWAVVAFIVLIVFLIIMGGQHYVR